MGHGSDGSLKLMGQMAHGSRPGSVTHDPFGISMFVVIVQIIYHYRRDFGHRNTRLMQGNIIIPMRNHIKPETVQAISLGYQN